MEEESTANTEEQQRMMAQLKSLLRQSLDEKAYSRMINVLLVNKALFISASQKLLAFSSKLGRQLTEKEVLLVLSRLKEQEQPRAGGISIRRK